MFGLPTLATPFCLHAALTLLHFLWQGLLLATLACLAGKCLRNRSAGTRYRVHGATLFVMLMCLPTTFVFLNQKGLAKPPNLVVEGVDIPQPSGPPSPFAASPTAPPPSIVAPVARWATALYLLGVTAMFARLFFGLAATRRLRRDARPLTDEELLATVRRHAQRFDLRQVPVVAYCDRVAVPALVGLWRPMILLPTVLATGLTPEQVELVIVHEMAHIRRWDNVWLVVQRVIESILFFHPAVWYVSRRLSIERELCCDEMVVGITPRRSEYAASLLRVAELTTTGQAVIPASATMTSPREGSAVFVHRLMRILGEAKSSPVRLLRFWPTLTVALLVIVTVCVLRLNVYASRATAAEMVLARSLVDQKLLMIHWEGLEDDEHFKGKLDEFFPQRTDLRQNPQVFNSAKKNGPQMDRTGQMLLAKLALDEDEIYQRMDSGALRYLKRVRVEGKCLMCHRRREGVFGIPEVSDYDALAVGDVLAVISVEIAPGATDQ